MGPPPPPPPPDGTARAGTLVAGRYRLERPLATGGMARVWTARDEVLDRPVAVKVLLDHLATDAAFVARFRAEALAAARLTHPAVVSVYDTSTAPEPEAIVMELIDGETLRHRLDREGRLAPTEAARIGARIAEALAVAHAAGIVHRDIKPANVLLATTGRVVVTDFGIAKAAANGDLTAGGQMLGTAKYLAPEQVEGHPVDGRADVYALGVVLFEAVCGRVPFAADTDSATALARLHRDPPPARELAPDLPPDLARVIDRTLVRDREGRWPDATSLGRALATLAAGRTLPPEPGRERPATPDLTKAPAPAPAPAPTEVVGDAEPATTSWRADDPAPAPPRPAPAPVPSPPPPRPAPPSPGGAPAFQPRTPPPAPPAPPPREEPRADTGAPSRPLGPRLLVAGVVAVSLVLIAVLGWALLGPDATESLRPVAAVAFDPHANDGENDDQAPLAVDGDPETGWSTSTYADRDITRLKPGVGLVLDLGETRTLDRLDVASPSQGWTAQVYVLDDVPDAATPIVDDNVPVAEVSDIDGDGTFRLAGAEGRVVVLWITRAGEDGRVTVSEAEVRVAA